MNSKDHSFFELDKNRLDSEWVSQVRLYHQYADALAEAREDWERAKAAARVADDDLKEIAARVDLEVRKDPQSFGLEKVTEGAVEKTVLVSKQHKRARQLMYNAHEEVIRTKRRVDDAETAVRTMDQRKQALEDLVRLRLSDYFSEPRTPRNADVRAYASNAAEDVAFDRRKRK